MQEFYPEENRLFTEKGISKIFGEWLTVDDVMQIVEKLAISTKLME